jgi:DNA-binding transcriptional ArsR family regulator
MIKTNFTHELHIGYSPVFEVLSVLSASIWQDKTTFTIMGDWQELYDLPEVEAWSEAMTGIESRQLWLFELTILIRERHDIYEFFNQVLDLKETSLKRAFFGFEIDSKEALLPIEDLFKIQNVKVSESFLSNLESLAKLVEIAKKAALALWENKRFKSQIDLLINEDSYQNFIDSCHENTDQIGRHPLSYAQELMGKPFWNISDYKRFEFIPVFFISPVRFRLMNGEAMIYVHPLHLKEKESLSPHALGHTLKVLSDPMRLKILKLIFMNPMYGKEIATELGLATSTVSHHLDLLSKQGLVNLEQVKHIKYFSTNYRRLSEILKSQETFFKDKN